MTSALDAGAHRGPRVCGLETEYGLVVETLQQVEGQPRWRRHSNDEAARLLFRPVVEASATTNVFLRNGGRLYLDVGSHPEYATPECVSLRDLVVHDRAGDQVMNRLADRAVEALAAEGIEARVRLFKNNLDSHGNTYGSHENYQVARTLTLRDFAGALTGFLVCRQLLCGAGSWVRHGEHGPQFWLSQRAAHTWDPLAQTTTRARPMINTRDEPHADPQRFRRLHVIVGDSTLAEPTTLLRVGSTELVLRAIEHGADLGRWTPADPATAIREVARDRRGRAPVRLADGSLTCALAVLEAVHRAVEPYVDSTELTEVWRLWGRVLQAVADDRLDLVHHDIDWAIKLRLLDGFAARGASPAKLAQIDLAHHDVRPGQGSFGRLEAAGQVTRHSTPDEVARAVDEAPATRARLRGRLVAAAQAHRRQYQADWMTFHVRDLTEGSVVLDDPVACDDPRVDDLVARMGAEPRRAESTRFTGGFRDLV